ncbi:MAG: hypothetical protein K0R55_2295 [Sporomusa sp.]|jgi:hypothetical protein|nr:hypothetical protein [Sporomusa sp.]
MFQLKSNYNANSVAKILEDQAKMIREVGAIISYRSNH